MITLKDVLLIMFYLIKLNPLQNIFYEIELSYSQT